MHLDLPPSLFVYELSLYTTPPCGRIWLVPRISFGLDHGDVFSPGYLSFLKHLKELESAVTDPGGLAVELYSNGLIDRVTRQRASLVSVTQLERSRELLQKLEDKIESEEAAFEKFLSILVRDPTFEDVCTKLRATRGNGLAST